MSGHHPPLLALLLPCLGLGAYDGLAHYVSTVPDSAHWAVMITLLPVGTFATGLAAKRFGIIGGVLGAAAAVALIAFLWPLLQHNLADHMSRLYLLQYLATNLGFGWFFGSTLGSGRTPACTSFAALLHSQMTPAVRRYTRQVTVAWTLFFVLSALISGLLYAFASTEAWSLFSNLAYLPSVALMFVVEGLVRRSALPPEERHGILDSIRAYVVSTQANPDARPPSAAGPPLRQ